MSDHEIDVYDEQTEFSRNFTIKVLDFFYSNKDIIFNKRNSLVAVLASELGRIYNEHGGREALITYLVFRSFDSFYRYAAVDLFFQENKDLIRSTESTLNEYIDLIYDLKTNLINQIDSYDAFSEILIKLGIDFRKHHLIYGDIEIQAQIEREERLELSPDAKTKIGNIIAESLKQGLNPK